MRQIVIIGNSAAGIAAAEAIRRRDRESRIIIFSEESVVAYDRSRILKFLEGKLKERELIFRNQDFYKNNALDLVCDSEVASINPDRKKVVLKDKDREPILYDELVIATGRRFVKPPLKGIQKEGVVSPDGLREIKFIMDNLPVAHTVLVVGPGPVAEEVARIIASRRIEVKYFGAPAQPAEGVDAIEDNPILEILGETEVRAVRLSNQKVVGASMVIFAGERAPRVAFLKETQVQIDGGILVDVSGRTNIPGIYAVGDVARLGDGEKVYGWQSALDQGALVGSTLCPT
jgi:NAD(P)H-nitrite reductase large subunit